jgi:hypothetical protein
LIRVWYFRKKETPGGGKCEISGKDPVIQQIYGLGMFWKLKHGLWSLKKNHFLEKYQGLES